MPKAKAQQRSSERGRGRKSSVSVGRLGRSAGIVVAANTAPPQSAKAAGRKKRQPSSASSSAAGRISATTTSTSATTTASSSGTTELTDRPIPNVIGAGDDVQPPGDNGYTTSQSGESWPLFLHDAGSRRHEESGVGSNQGHVSANMPLTFDTSIN